MATSTTQSNRILLAVGLLLGVLSVLIILPFLQWILVGTILAYALVPVNERLSRRLSPGLSAGLSMLIGLVVLVLPLVVVLGVAASQGRQLIAAFEPGNVTQLDRLIEEQIGVEVDIAVLHDAISGAAKTGARGLAGSLFSILGGLPELFISFTVLFFVMFYLLKDGHKAVVWIETVLPLDPDTRDELFEETNLLLYNSLVGTVVVSLAQAALLAVAFLFLGLGNVIFWLVLTFVLAMIPLVGASLVWAPASVYLFLIERPVAAVVLLAFGALVISTVDNILRPVVMQRGTQLSPVITIVGIFGGIALFGFVGLFVGPIILGMTKLVIEILTQESASPVATE